MQSALLCCLIAIIAWQPVSCSDLAARQRKLGLQLRGCCDIWVYRLMTGASTRLAVNSAAPSQLTDKTRQAWQFARQTCGGCRLPAGLEERGAPIVELAALGGPARGWREVREEGQIGARTSTTARRVTGVDYATVTSGLHRQALEEARPPQRHQR